MEPLHGSELYQLGWQDRTKALEQQAIGRKGGQASIRSSGQPGHKLWTDR